jgi:glutamate racemase
MGRAGMVGILDSGIGGTLIEQEVRRLLPGVEVYYLKDTEHFPYGRRDPDEVVRIIDENCRALVAKGARLIVLACNSASVVSLAHLRDKHRVPFVGVVPAVKPAAELTRTKEIAVFGTTLTTRSAALQELVDRFCAGIAVHKLAFPDLAEAIERGEMDRARHIVAATWQKHRHLRIDVVVLGCTHYTLIRDDIQRIVGPDVRVIDSNFAVAKQTARVWARLVAGTGQ